MTNEIETQDIEQLQQEQDQVQDQAQSDNDKNKKDEYEGHRFKNGQLLNMIRVRFPGNCKSFPFLIGNRKVAYGQKVVAMSDRGMDVGYVNSFPYDIEYHDSMGPIKSILKVATEKDVTKQKRDFEKEVEIESLCKQLIEKHQLEMDLTHVEFTQFGKKAIFYFTAPGRVDFRELVKDLVAQLKMRIELRQISIRDRAAALGGLGPCGKELCCSSFLQNLGNVNIKMAKNQGLTLSPNKLNGMCCQLKCCLRYEDDVYKHKRSILPKEGDFIMTASGDKGRVDCLNLIDESFDLITDRGQVRRYDASEFNPETRLPEGWTFPERFDHIADETSAVIGRKICQESCECMCGSKDLQSEAVPDEGIVVASFGPEEDEDAVFAEEDQDHDQEELAENNASTQNTVAAPLAPQTHIQSPPANPQARFEHNRQGPHHKKHHHHNNRKQQPYQRPPQNKK